MTTEDELMDYIEHFGVKGQKWGVRKDRGHEGEKTKTKKIGKLDKKFERGTTSLHTTIAVHNRAATLTNAGMDHINNKPEYKGQDFSRDSPLRQKYYKEHQDSFMNNLHKAAAELGTNASGTKKYKILEKVDGSWDIFTADVQHASDDPLFTVNVEYDSSGHIVGIDIPEELVQSEFEILDFLEHHGVKGQKWGVRRKKTGFKPSADAKKTKELRKKPTSSLTNKQLKTANERLNLEQNFNRLNPTKVAAGRKVATDLLATIGIGVTVFNLVSSPAGKAAIAAGKKMLSK